MMKNSRLLRRFKGHYWSWKLEFCEMIKRIVVADTTIAQDAGTADEMMSNSWTGAGDAATAHQ
jgi:hypothetical protein